MRLGLLDLANQDHLLMFLLSSFCYWSSQLFSSHGSHEVPEHCLEDTRVSVFRENMCRSGLVTRGRWAQGHTR